MSVFGGIDALMFNATESSAEHKRHQWLADARNGDDASLSKLLQSDRDYLLLIAAAELDSDLVVKTSHSDLVQDSLLEAQQGFENFRGETHGQWRQWLKTILKNNVKDLRRRYVDAEKRSIRKEVDGCVTEDNQQCGSDESPSRIALRNEQIQQLAVYMTALPPHYQTAIRLRFWKQLAYEEMAVQMDSTPEAVRKIVYRAVEALVDGFTSQIH
jgi:RNA polymerase sigma-70 factor (ECF subfamily)